jgi:myo-inositol catabolism protein IolC
MTLSHLGYPKDLFILPFDHRGSFETGLLGPEFSRAGRDVTPEELERLAGYKRVIYEGFLEAVEKGVPAESAAVLVDQKYGEAILADANQRGITTCVTVEKSGQDEFDFEYGHNFRQRIQDASPVFAKVLVRYNPEGDAAVNKNQRRRLKVLSDYTHSAGYKFMFELLVPATKAQLESAGQDRHAYDLKARPQLMVKAIKELQEAGIEPDVWKLEGMDEPEAAQKVAAQARSGGRDKVGIIILGRGEDEKRVDHWLTVGARTKGVIGFAVGRTTFWQPLVDLKDGKTSRAQAVSRIAGNYHRIYQLFVQARAGAGSPHN